MQVSSLTHLHTMAVHLDPEIGADSNRPVTQPRRPVFTTSAGKDMHGCIISNASTHHGHRLWQPITHNDDMIIVFTCHEVFETKQIDSYTCFWNKWSHLLSYIILFINALVSRYHTPLSRNEFKISEFIIFLNSIMELANSLQFYSSAEK